MYQRYSVLNIAETVYDSFGVIKSQEVKNYYVQSLNWTGSSVEGDLELKNADLSLEYRSSILYDDAININKHNASGGWYTSTIHQYF